MHERNSNLIVLKTELHPKKEKLNESIKVNYEPLNKIFETDLSK